VISNNFTEQQDSKTMPRIKLNAEWSRLMESYRLDHQNKVNQAFHAVGIPLIVGSFPVGATIVGLPLAAGMFTVGWACQFIGHAFEGKKPSFVSDKRSLVIGVLWWTKKVGLNLVEEVQLGPTDATGASEREAA
jgi:uncharacterized membrane protein YGL010W